MARDYKTYEGRVFKTDKGTFIATIREWASSGQDTAIISPEYEDGRAAFGWLASKTPLDGDDACRASVDWTIYEGPSGTE